jgi:hypothetical protein
MDIVSWWCRDSRKGPHGYRRANGPTALTLDFFSPYPVDAAHVSIANRCFKKPRGQLSFISAVRY